MEKKHTRLNSQTDCRRFLARAINETKAGAMTPDDLKRVRKTAKTAHINPSDFAREAIEKAIKEIEDDSERLEKNKR